MFLTRCIDAERHHQAVLGEDDPVEEDRHEIQGLKRGGLPAPHLRGGARHETPAHAALTRAATPDLRWERFQAPRVATRRHAQKHLFDDAPVERIGLGHGLERRQRHLLLPSADTGPTDLDLAPAQDDGTGRRARATGCALGLVRVPRPADRDPILFEHGLEDLHPRSHDELGQLRARVDQQIDQRQVS